MTQRLTQLQLPSSIYDEIVYTHEHHVPTRYHQEGVLDHLEMCGAMCARIASQFGVDNEDAARWIGFMHDLGKGLARRPVGKRVIFTGHAQLGGKLVDEILTVNPELVPIEYHVPLVYCTTHHMCRMTSTNNSSTLANSLANSCSLVSFTIPSEHRQLTIRCLCMLFTADELSRVGTVETVGEQELCAANLGLMEKWLASTISYSQIRSGLHIETNTIIVFLLGLSGSGKSTFAACLKQQFAHLNITHVERDQCMLKVASSSNESSMKTENVEYKQAYQYVAENNLKGEVQKEWVQQLTDALENTQTQLMIVDTVQTLFPKGWNQTYQELSEEARFRLQHSLRVGFYFIPIHQLHPCVQFESKTGSYTKLPEPTLFYPEVGTEFTTTSSKPSNNTMNSLIHVGLPGGCARVDLSFINEVVQLTSLQANPQQQYNCLEAIKHVGGDIELLKSHFSADVLILTTEYEDQDIKIITVCYKDGMQTFTGITRDYRGETVFLNKLTGNYQLLRGALPVFPDYCSYERDPWIVPYVSNGYAGDSHINVRIALTFKYDGSMFNCVYIPHAHAGFEKVKEAVMQCSHPDMLLTVETGLLVFGSKGRFMIAPSHPIRHRIKKAIQGSYGDIESFGRHVQSFLTDNNFEHECVTLHFEAIDTTPTSELTVLYSRAMCPLLGYTVFSAETGQKRFELPSVFSYFVDQTKVLWFESWIQVQEYMQQLREQCLAGDVEVEPEGCVVHIFDESEGGRKWHPIKVKHDFYYVAHKPHTKRNQELAEQIRTSDQYAKLRERLTKFQHTVSVKELMEQAITEEWCEYLHFPPEAYTSRREYALYVQSNISKIEEAEEEVMKQIRETHPFYEMKLMRVMYMIFPEKLTRENALRALFNKGNVVSL
jgi:hypothetical protein